MRTSSDTGSCHDQVSSTAVCILYYATLCVIKRFCSMITNMSVCIYDSTDVENPETHEITDMCSFYTLPSTVIGHQVHKTLKAAYSFYHVANSVEWPVLMNDALILAKNEGFDVFNALNVMENDKYLKALKFGIGDGGLNCSCTTGNAHRWKQTRSVWYYCNSAVIIFANTSVCDVTVCLHNGHFTPSIIICTVRVMPQPSCTKSTVVQCLHCT